MYYMAYGNNDYRDYVMAHSLGEWTKPVKYIAKKVVNGVTRYIYEPAKTGIQKHVTGSYYKNKASGAMSAYKQHKTSSEMMSRAVSEANKGYSRSLAGRANAARSRVGSALRKAGYNIRTASRSLIERGRNLVNKAIGAAKKTATKAYNSKTLRNVTGGYYKQQMNKNLENMHRASENKTRGNSERFDRERDSYRKNREAYEKSLAGRLESATKKKKKKVQY